MQSGGYGSGGGVSEIQQFMVDGGCPASLFSISGPPPNPNSSSGAEIQKFHLLAPHPHQSQPPPHLQPPLPQFSHFGHPIPITQQLFQQSHHHHQFQLFHHQNNQQQQQQQHHLGLEQDQPGQENSNSPAGSFLAAMNFKLGVDESSGGGSRDGLNDDDGILQGDDGSESRLHRHHHHHHRHHHNSWHREEESVAATAGNIKEPFWRPLDIDFISPSNKRPARDEQPAAGEMSSSNVKHFKKSAGNESIDHTNTVQNAAVTDSNYKLFSELEAICKPGGTPSGGGRGGGNNTNQTGSGSALTGDDNPLMPAAGPGPAIQHDNVSDTSDDGEAPAQPLPVGKSSSKGRKKRSKKKKQQKQLASIAAFFETLVKQLMDHQEVVHQKFLEVMERRDQERTSREEAWRKQEAARASREAAGRAQERALAASRESAIIAFLEKITGESIVLPTKAQFLAHYTEEESQKEHDEEGNAEAVNALEPYNAASANNNAAAAGVQLMSSSRWPKTEVRALIRVRSGFETRFQEPGLKGPLWEEVSKEMAAMGYCRSAKRCKEKWENINKYFRKTKDSGKKRPQHSKTCPYFHQLDQLYSSASNARTAINSAAGSEAEQRKDNSELLDAIVVANEPGQRKAAEISNEGEQDDYDGNEEGQGESQGDDDGGGDDDDRHGHLQLCGDNDDFHGGIRS